MQETDTMRRLVETLQTLINALNNRLTALDGASSTPTPTATNTPASVLEYTPTPTNTPVTALEATPTATTIPTATPTRASASTLAPGCIRNIGLGWLTGAWNADCLSDKTPATAKAGNRYARFYTFTLDTPATVTVSISSTDVAHTYLYLLEGRGNEGSTVNRGDARITEQLHAGTYTIEATTYDTETAGAFTLTMDISTTTPVR